MNSNSILAGTTRGRWRRVAAGVLALLALLAVTAGSAFAQTQTAILRGYVRSTGGAPIEGVQVSARNVENNITRGTLTNASGYYYLAGLRPGRYEVSARRVGFEAQLRSVTLQVGATTDLVITTSEAVAQLAEVRVQAAPSATAKTSEVGTNVSREQIENLPNFERNFLDIAKLAPGITAQTVDNNNKVLAAGGQPADAVNVFIDGASYKNDVLKGGVVGQDASKGNPFPQGAVQEFRVITQNYKAEYQKAASAVITATTRSGTNRWEGDVFGFFINKGLVERNSLGERRNDPRPDYWRTQAGGSVGGPLVQDKLFVFGTYELNFRDEPQIVRLGTSASSAPASLNLQQYLGQHVTEFREHLGFGKLTWAKSDRSTVDASLNIRREEDFTGFGGQTATSASEKININVYTGVANWRYSGDKWLNEAQVNMQRFIWNPEATNPTLPGLEYQGLLRVGGKDTWQDFTQDRLALRNDISRGGMRWAGEHAFKGGLSLDLMNYDVEKAFVANPIYKFRSTDNWTDPFAVAVGWGDPHMTARNMQFGGYVQDDWTVTPQLVLNLGIRWDGETNGANNSYRTPDALATYLRTNADSLYVNQPVPTSTGGCCDQVKHEVVNELGGIENFISKGRESRPMYKRAFQPRVGASYDLLGDGRTVLFGGFGIYYDRNYWNTLLDEQFRQQYNLMWHYEFNASNPWSDTYFDKDALIDAIPVPRREVFLVKNDLRPPRTHQFSGGVRQQLGPVRMTLSYNGMRGYNFMNFIRASDWGGATPANASSPYAVIFAADDRVRTYYDAVQLQLERPMRVDTRWGGAIAYTLGRAQEQGQSTDMFWGWNDKYPTVADRPRLRSPGDQRHAVTANALVRLPYDFRMSTIITLGSGVTVNATNASGGWGPYQQGTYVFTPPSRPFLGLGHAFATQNADLRLEKGLGFARGQNATIVFDMYNAFNSTNYGCYETTIVPTADQNADWRARFQQPSCAALGRRLQIGVRYGYRGAGPETSRAAGGQ